MRFQIRKLFLLLLLSQLFIPLVYAGDWEDNKSSVGTSTSSHVLDSGKHWSFMSEGLHWVFYSHSNSYYGFRTSSDGVSWSAFTLFTVVTIHTSGFDLVYDNSTGFVHFLYGGTYGYLRYRRGDPQSDGTMVYNSTETAINSANDFFGVSIDIDFNGRVYGAYGRSTGNIEAIRNAFTNETWSMTGGFPVVLNASASGRTDTVVLDNDEVVFLYSNKQDPPGQYVLEDIYFDSNSSWRGEVTASAELFYHTISAVNRGNDTYMGYTVSPNEIYFNKRLWTESSWNTSAETDVTNLGGGQHEVCLSYEYLNDKVYIIKNSITPDQLLNITYYNATSDTFTTEEIVYEPYVLYRWFLSCSLQTYNNTIGIHWVYPDYSPYTVRYTYMEFTSPSAPPSPDVYNLPVRLAMGLVGLVLIVLDPVLTVDQVVKKKNYRFFIVSIILFSIGYALVTGWLVP